MVACPERKVPQEKKGSIDIKKRILINAFPCLTRMNFDKEVTVVFLANNDNEL